MKLAAFESLEFLFSKKRDELYSLSFKESPLRPFTSANYASDRILDMRGTEGWPDEERLMRESNLAQLLLQAEVQVLGIDTRSSELCESWAKAHGLKLLVTPYKLQKDFENKIFFEDFLVQHNLPKPEGMILESAEDTKNIPWLPVVIQKPESDGSKGTYVITSQAELKTFLSSEDAVFPLLARQFIDGGLPLGVSLIIGDKKSVFSALRLQVFFPRSRRFAAYLGIQWLRSDFFSDTQKAYLNDAFQKLASALRGAGFRGVANVDFFYREGQLYYIECNPRQGGATPQLSYKSELLHGLDFVEEFSSSLFSADPSADLPFIPESRYEGCNVDLEYFSDLLEGKTYAPPAIGFYAMADDCTFQSVALADFSGRDRFMFYHAHSAPLRYSGQFLGFALMHRPLVSATQGVYLISPEGGRRLEALSQFMVKHTK